MTPALFIWENKPHFPAQSMPGGIVPQLALIAVVLVCIGFFWLRQRSASEASR